jgi:hypothetical protein
VLILTGIKDLTVGAVFQNPISFAGDDVGPRHRLSVHSSVHMKAFRLGLASAVVFCVPTGIMAQTTDREWACSVLAYTYIVPDDTNYVQPTFIADRDRLHLEARYSYEDRKTGSAWLGYNFSFGDAVGIEFTPMIGGIFGRTAGVAPGYKASLSYKKLEFSTEGEYVFDFGDSADNFFYTWSELSVAPVDQFRVGVAIQRTKVYQTDFDIQRGFLVGVSFGRVDFTTYVFNPDDDPTVVLGFGIEF